MKSPLSSLLFLIIIICSSSLIAQNSSNIDVQTEEDALIALYNATDGDNWTNNTNWLSEEPLGDWFGVTTDGDGNITQISLENNNLIGNVPSDLGSILNLQNLYLANNQLTGIIPSELGDLLNIQNLSLYNNQLTGSIPTEFGNLSNLTLLNLEINQLTGSIPSELGNLTNLEVLDLNDNQLIGSIPLELGDLTNIWGIVLSSNQLTGNIPLELGNLTNLNHLYLDNNQLTGSIPSELGNISDLGAISLGSNQLSGSIPSELWNLLNLQSLHLYDNQLSGNIPSELGNLTNLEYLSLHDNQFSGIIPIVLGSLTNLIELSLGDNQLSGAIPIVLGNLINLESLYLNNNQLTGSIPSELGSIFNLAVLELSNNQLESPIPPNICTGSDNLMQVGLHANMFTAEDCSVIQCIIDRNLDSFNHSPQTNGFNFDTDCGGSSNIEKAALIALYNATDGDNWTDNTNWLSEEPLGEWFGVSTNSEGHVIDINLDENNLIGTFPSEMGELIHLYGLQLYNNQISGSLPQAISNCSQLAVLDINFNQFSGSIPSEIGNLTNLTHLYLSNNNLENSIPSELGNLPGLVILHLNDNELVSPIPFELCENWQNIVELELNNNYFDSQDCDVINCFIDMNLDFFQHSPQSNGFNFDTDCGGTSNIEEEALIALYNATDGDNWTDNTNWLSEEPLSDWFGVTTDGDGYVTELILYSNQLSGTIPSEIGNLIKLTQLSLNNNQLIGVIPIEISNLSNLTHLFFSGNQISGSIPPELGNLSNLQHLYLVDNQISGSIPPELGNLSNLQYLYLTSNQISGSIPPELGNLSILFALELSDNLLVGSMPPELGDLTNLALFGIMDNQLSGSLPSEIGNLSNLLVFDIRINQFSGIIPSELGSLSNLQEFQIESNQFTGNIPVFIGVLYNLQELFLSDNQFIGSIPSEIGDLSNLETLLINDNQLTGIVPDEFVNLSNLQNLSLNNNHLSVFPPELSSLSLDNSSVKDNDFSFEDLQNMPYGINYNPQNTIPLYDTTYLEAGIQGTIQLDFDNDITNSTYNWYKQGSLIATTTENSLVLTEEFGGTYYYNLEITNTDFPGFTLEVDSVIVIVEGETNPIIEEEALIAIYNATDGDNWNNNTNWLSDEPLGNWFGVTTNNDYVIKLDLFENNLNGYIPNEIGNLVEIQEIQFYDNQLSGTIPYEIGSLTSLEGLYLFDNELSGTIPVSIGNLPQLVSLSLHYNQLSGEIPSELGSLVNLIDLVLANNQLTGEIPPELGSLVSLVNLNLGGNNLTGGIPTELCNLVNVNSLGLLDNMLTGSIPNEIGNMTSLYEIRLENNQLSGVIPSEIGDLSGLGFLFLDNNLFVSPIPPSLCADLENISKLYLNNNLFDSQDCEVVNCFIDLNLETFQHSPQSNGFDFNTDCEGSSSNIDSLVLVALYNSTDGDNWINNNNWLSEEPIGDWYGVTIDGDGYVIMLDLYENNLNGFIPNELGDLSNLVFLQLGTNQLSGSIPAELGGLSHLEGFALKDNLLIGVIPLELGNLSNLQHLVLSGNQLSGELPAELGNLNNLIGMHLQDNEFSGSIPVEFGNMSLITELVLSNNQLTGGIPDEISNLSYLTLLYINDNLLTGSLPAELGSLQSIDRINLSTNNFSGIIPAEFSNFSTLTDLYLHGNSFDVFPSELSTLSISYSNASMNNFTFEDLINFPFGMEFDPQNTIYIYDTTILEVGVEGIIQLDFDNDIINSTYHWYKEGQGLIATTTENSLNIIEENVGTYFYNLIIENSDFSDFSLSVDSVIVVVTDCGVSVSSVIQNISCKGESTGEIILNAVGGIPPYSYSIDNGMSFQSENIFSNLDLGVYQAVVVDNNDCYNYLELEITEPLELLTYNITTVDVTCFGGNDASIEIMAQGGDEPYEYSKDGGLVFQSSNVFESLIAGDYQIVLMDANKCEITELINVQEPDSGPEVFFTGLEIEYCNNSSLIELLGNQVPNGWFEGEGIFDNNDGTAIFNPTLVTFNQSHTIKYYYEDDLGCNGLDEQSTIVYESPIAAFNYGLGSCIESAAFFDLSSSSNGNITNWNWDFDDPESEGENTSSIQNPLHYFVSNQSAFNIELIIDDEIGCSDTVNQLIEPYSTTTIMGHVFTNEGVDITDGYVLAFLLSDGMISKQVDSVRIAEDASFAFVNLATCVDYIFHAYSNEEVYPDVVPRWHFEAFYWFDAVPIFVDWEDELVGGVDISLFEMIPSPVGNSSISGGVYYTGRKGEPVKNVDVVLEFDEPDDKGYRIVGYQDTDELGKWKFNQLGEGDFKIKVDIPGLSMDSVYQVSISNLNSEITGLNYYVDIGSGIYIAPTGLDEFDDLGFGSIGVFPNPNTGQFYLEIIKADHISRLNINTVQLWDMEGRLIKDLGIEFKGDHYLSHLSLSDIEPGMYFIKVKNKEEVGVVKFVIQR